MNCKRYATPKIQYSPLLHKIIFMYNKDVGCSHNKREYQENIFIKIGTMKSNQDSDSLDSDSSCGDRRTRKN